MTSLRWTFKWRHRLFNARTGLVLWGEKRPAPLGPAPLGPAHLDPALLGTAPLRSALLSTAPLGPALLGTAPLGTAPLGTGNCFSLAIYGYQASQSEHQPTHLHTLGPSKLPDDLRVDSFTWNLLYRYLSKNTPPLSERYTALVWTIPRPCANDTARPHPLCKLYPPLCEWYSVLVHANGTALVCELCLALVRTIPRHVPTILRICANDIHYIVIALVPTIPPPLCERYSALVRTIPRLFANDTPALVQTIPRLCANNTPPLCERYSALVRTIPRLCANDTPPLWVRFLRRCAQDLLLSHEQCPIVFQIVPYGPLRHINDFLPSYKRCRVLCFFINIFGKEQPGGHKSLGGKGGTATVKN